MADCALLRLCRAAGEPEVALLLSPGAAVCFGEVLGTVALARSRTIAAGDDVGPFEPRRR